MKRNLFFTSFLLFLIQMSYSQNRINESKLTVFISTGYSIATSNIVHDYYNAIVDSYNSSGVPVLTQTKFGSTVVVNAGVLFGRLKNFRIGFSLGYWYSPAYSNYEDNAGTLKVNGSTSSYEISLKVQTVVANIGDFPLNLTIQPGISYASFAITEEIKYLSFTQLNYDSKCSGYAWGPCGLLTLGSAVQLGEFKISIDSGYRIGTNTVAEVFEDISTGKKNKYGNWEIGNSGFVALISIGINL